MKPIGWPRHMREKRLASGMTAYFWAPPTRATKAGFTISSEALGADYGAARERAMLLNQHLDAWREGQGAEKTLDASSGVGSVEWAVEVYKRGPAWARYLHGHAPSTSAHSSWSCATRRRLEARLARRRSSR